MKILAFNGSPRTKGNSKQLLQAFLEGAAQNKCEIIIDEINAHTANVEPCSGCLRCNMIKRCALRHDDWPEIHQRILDADLLVWASPVYFHHVTAPLKIILDRFRSFMHVRITETGLVHTPWQEWQKKWVAILSLGSSSLKDTEPIIDLFKFLTGVLGPSNPFQPIIGTRLAVQGQVSMAEEELKTLYGKLELPPHLATPDFQRNRRLMAQTRQLGKTFASGGRGVAPDPTKGRLPLEP
ncbi:MAG: flavodoxin family protein [bacterium]|nr:flavodoxin family protein [bacterium]